MRLCISLANFRHSETFNNCKPVVSRGRRRENNMQDPKHKWGFSRKRSFLNYLGGMVSPRSTACDTANTLHAGQALSFATSEVALMPIKAVTTMTEILLLNCCLTQLNTLRRICFIRSHTWFLCKIILRGIALNAAKTAFLKWSSIQKTNFLKAINYKRKRKLLSSFYI